MKYILLLGSLALAANSYASRSVIRDTRFPMLPLLDSQRLEKNNFEIFSNISSAKDYQSIRLQNEVTNQETTSSGNQGTTNLNLGLNYRKISKNLHLYGMISLISGLYLGSQYDFFNWSTGSLFGWNDCCSNKINKRFWWTAFIDTIT